MKGSRKGGAATATVTLGQAVILGRRGTTEAGATTTTEATKARAALMLAVGTAEAAEVGTAPGRRMVPGGLRKQDAATVGIGQPVTLERQTVMEAGVTTTTTGAKAHAALVLAVGAGETAGVPPAVEVTEVPAAVAQPAVVVIVGPEEAVTAEMVARLGTEAAVAAETAGLTKTDPRVATAAVGTLSLAWFARIAATARWLARACSQPPWVVCTVRDTALLRSVREFGVPPWCPRPCCRRVPIATPR